MKILKVAPDDILIGGVHKRMIIVTKKLVANGFEVDFLVAKSEGARPFTKLCKEEKIKTWVFSGVYRPSRIKDLKSFLRNVKYIVELPISIFSAIVAIKNSKCDIVHVNGLLNIVPFIAAKLIGKKICYHVIGDHYPKLLIWLTKPFFLLSDTNIFIANKLKAYYNPFCSESKNFTLYEPLPINISKTSKSDNSFIWKEFGLETKDFIVGNVANYTPAKGWDNFLDIAFEILKNHSEKKIVFLCVGAIVENHKHYYRKIINRVEKENLHDNFIFTGFRKDAYQIMQTFDLLLMPSKKEGTPLTILEAFMADTPVVSSNCGGIQEQIISGNNGYLCNPDNVSCFVEKSLKILNNKKIAKQFKKEGKRRLNELFTIEKHIKNLESIYFKMM